MYGINDRLRVGMDVATQPPEPSFPRMIGRAWLTTPTSSGPLTYLQYDAPVGTRYIVARGIGGGGGRSGGPSDIANAGGGGGAYAKAIFPLFEGERIQYLIGRNASANGFTECSIIRSSGTIATVFRADRGGNTSGASGAGGTLIATSSYVTSSRTGSSGASKLGGAPGNDLSDIDTLYLTGTGASPSIPATGFGAGCAVEQTSVSTATEYAGTSGVLVLEFWTGDPR